MPPKVYYSKLIAHVNRKDWWHVPPANPDAYGERGQFLASSFREAEFWGRPLDEPVKVRIAQPLVGDEDTIERELFGRRVSSQDMPVEQRWALDAKMKQTAVARGYDSIVLMTEKAFSKFRTVGKLPRSLELNVFQVHETGIARTRRRSARIIPR